MNVSSVKNLNGEVFSAVQDASLTNVVQTNSGNWQDITAYQNNSASYQLSGNYIPYTAYDDSNTAFETNSGLSINRFGEGGLYNTLLSPNTIQMSFVASPTLYYWAILSDTSLKFETSSDSAYVDKEKIHTWDSASYYIQNISANWDDVSTTVQTNSASWAEEVISSYTTATIEGINAINSLNGKPLISFRTQSAQEAGTANKARYDYDGNNLADDHNSLTALNNVVQTNSAQWAEQPTYEYDISNKISAINGSAIAGGDEFPASADEAVQYVQTNSAGIDDTVNNVQTNSGAWGGSALPISAGPGVKVNLVDNTLVFSNDETVLFTTADINKTTAFTLTEPLTSFEKVRFEITGYTNVYAENTHQTPSANNEEITTCFTYYCKSSDGNPLQMMMGTYSSNDGLNYGVARSKFLYMSNDGTTWNGNTTDGPHIQKIVGINRIAGGN